MKLIFTITICLIATISAYSQYTASWGNNTGGTITREQLFNDSLVLNSVNGQGLSYVITSFVLSYGYSGLDAEYRIDSNKLHSGMKKVFRSFPIGERFYINNIKAIINTVPVTIHSTLMMNLVGPEGCLRKDYSLLLTRRNGKMSKKQFLDNKILDVYIPGDYNSLGKGTSSRIDTSFTVHSYIFSYHLKDERLRRYIEVNSNIITEEIRDIVRELPNYKFRYENQSLVFSVIKTTDSNGDTVSVRDLTISIPKEYYFPDIKNVHPKARELMNEEFLFSRKDKTGPFGSHNATETYFSFYDWRSEIKNENPKVFLLNQIKYKRKYPLFDLSTKNYRLLKPYIERSSMHFSFLTGIDREIITVAFGQLYLEGEIDNEILKMTEDALVRQLNPKLISKWPDDYEEEREYKLKKMLEIIRKLK